MSTRSEIRSGGKQPHVRHRKHDYFNDEENGAAVGYRQLSLHPTSALTALLKDAAINRTISSQDHAQLNSEAPKSALLNDYRQALLPQTDLAINSCGGSAHNLARELRERRAHG